MTRLLTDGAEYGDKLWWTSSTANLSASTTQKRSGAYSYSGTVDTFYKVFTAASEVYVRVAWYAPIVYGRVIAGLRKDGTVIGKVVMKSDGSNKLEIYVGGSLVATSTLAYAINTWHLLEWRLKIDDTVGVSEIKIDGLVDGTFSGDTKPGSDTQVNELYICADGRGELSYWDDIALNNTSGGVDNTWCGDGHIELLVPSGNSPDGGWSDQWTGSDGNSTDNYALVDEVPPASADYVEDSVAGHQDRYALTDFNGTGKAILHVWVEGRAIDTVPEGAQMKLGLRINGSNYLSSAISLSGNYSLIAGTVYEVNPDDSAAWEDADIDAAQILIEVV